MSYTLFLSYVLLGERLSIASEPEQSFCATLLQCSRYHQLDRQIDPIIYRDLKLHIGMTIYIYIAIGARYAHPSSGSIR